VSYLLFLLLLAAGLFVYSTYAVLRSPRRYIATPEAVETLSRFVGLPSLDFKHASALFDPADYKLIVSDPRLAQTAAQLREDRRHLALEWLKLLEKDIFLLWRFRRLLTVAGVFEGVQAEVATAGRVILIVLLIAGLRMSVAIAWPFAFSATASRARESVRSFSLYCATAVGRMPIYQLNALEQRWREREMGSAS
jgi:hypothetical protein